MPGKANFPGGNLGGQLTDGVKDLFSERAQWVRTWIGSRALPFIALIALVMSFLEIGAGGMRGVTAVLTGSIILVIVGIRSVRPILEKRWSSAVGNYQASMALLGALFLFAPPDGYHSLPYSAFIFMAFWCLSAAYVRKWLVPGEFVVTAVAIAAVTASSSPPIESWMFITLVFAPVMGVFVLKYGYIKPALMLAAILLAVWIGSDPEIIWLAMIAAFAMLVACIYAIGKLATPGSSSVIQSVGLGVVSGLLLFIVFKLLGADLGSPAHWWLTFAAFAGICGIIHRRQGAGLTPLLVLWCIHWGVATAVVTLQEWMLSNVSDDFFALTCSLLIGGFALRFAASSFNSNRLYVWSRLYLVLAALSFSLASLPTGFIGILVPTIAVVLLGAAIYFSKGRSYQKGAAWWRGVISPRHVVGMRKTIAKGGNLIASVPFVGATASALIHAVRVLARLKSSGGGFHSGDMMLIVVALCLSILLPAWFIAMLPPEVQLSIYNWYTMELYSAMDPSDLFTSTLQVITAGGLFGLIGLSVKEPLHRMLAMAAFFLAPMPIFTETGDVNQFFWWVCLVSAIGILTVNEVRVQDGASAALAAS